MKLKKQNNKVAIIMGSQSDHPVMKECEKILKILKVKYQVLIVSAHRTPKRMFKFAETAENFHKKAKSRMRIRFSYITLFQKHQIRSRASRP